MKINIVAMASLMLALAPELILASEDAATDMLQKRDFDSFTVFNRKRNAHACIMCIVFIVLLPLGAISVHLPIDRIPGLRNTYLRHKIVAIHAPIQVLALVMMVGGMALGIRLAHDLDYLTRPTIQYHPIIGLIVVCTIILFQPILGILQHRHFKRTGKKSIFAYVHRWIGRCAIILGMINSGFGYQLAKKSVFIPTSSYVRTYVLLAAFLAAWWGFVLVDEIRSRMERRRVDGGEKGVMERPKGAPNTAGSDDQEMMARNVVTED